MKEWTSYWIGPISVRGSDRGGTGRGGRVASAGPGSPESCR